MEEVEPRSSAIVTTTATSGATSFITTDLLLTAGDTSAIESSWAYVTSATAAAAALVGQQRPLLAAGLAISTGEASLANPFTMTVPAGTELEIHLRYPVKRGPGTPWVSG